MCSPPLSEPKSFQCSLQSKELKNRQLCQLHFLCFYHSSSFFIMRREGGWTARRKPAMDETHGEHLTGSNRNILQLKAWNTGSFAVTPLAPWSKLESSAFRSSCQDVKQPWPQGQRPKDLQFLAFGGAAQTQATLQRRWTINRCHFCQKKSLVHTDTHCISILYSLNLFRSDPIRFIDK